MKALDAVAPRQGTLDSHCLLDERQGQLALQARMYFYSTTSLPKSFFVDPHFLRLLDFTVKSTKHVVHKLTTETLDYYGDAEFELLLKSIRFIMAKKYMWGMEGGGCCCLLFSFISPFVASRHKEMRGNPCVQVIHDGGTLGNHDKYLGLAAQVVMPDGGPNMILTLALYPSADNTGEVLAALINRLFLERTGYTVQSIANRVVSDGAATHVATHLGLRTSLCLLCCVVLPTLMLYVYVCCHSRRSVHNAPGRQGRERRRRQERALQAACGDESVSRRGCAREQGPWPGQALPV